MHEVDGIIGEDASSVVDPVVHLGDEEMGEVPCRGEKPSDRVMEELVVRVFFVGSIPVGVRDCDIIQWKVSEAEAGVRHGKGGEDMLGAVEVVRFAA